MDRARQEGTFDREIQRSRTRWVMRVVIAAIVVVGLLGVIVVGIVLTIGLRGPETFVVPGRQVPERFVGQIRKMGLLEDGEQIKYFYSDAVIDIKGGIYAATDRKLILYCDDWKPPQILVRYEDIAAASLDRSTTWLVDSTVTLTLRDGTTVDFPLSSERGGDRRFVDYVNSRLASGDR